MGKLTTHILDTAHGKPAEGVAVRLFSIGRERILIKSDISNDDGRLDTPLMEGDNMTIGTYEIEFDIGEYFRKLNVPMDEPAFVDEVVLRFGIASTEQHYHVPLVATPWSYSTYRGS